MNAFTIDEAALSFLVIFRLFVYTPPNKVFYLTTSVLLGCSVFSLFFANLSLYDLQGANRHRNLVQNFFRKILCSSCPGETLKQFGG